MRKYTYVVEPNRDWVWCYTTKTRGTRWDLGTPDFDIPDLIGCGDFDHRTSFKAARRIIRKSNLPKDVEFTISKCLFGKVVEAWIVNGKGE